MTDLAGELEDERVEIFGPRRQFRHDSDRFSLSESTAGAPFDCRDWTSSAAVDESLRSTAEESCRDFGARSAAAEDVVLVRFRLVTVSMTGSIGNSPA